MNLMNKKNITHSIKGLKDRSRRSRKKLALVLVSAALVTRMTAAPLPPAPDRPVQPPTVIAYEMPAEETRSELGQATAVAAEPEVFGFWGLHRRIWQALAAPVKSGLWHSLWRALSALVAIALAFFCTLVWPLPQLWSRTKHKFKDFVASPRFTRFAFWVKLAVGLSLLAGYLLIPTARRPWLLAIAAACLALLGLTYYWTYQHAGDRGKEESQNLELLQS